MPPTHINYADASVSDAEGIAALVQDGCERSYSDVLRCLRHRRRASVVATAGSMLVGVALGTVSGEDPDTFLLTYIGTAAGVRRRGVGRHMLQQLREKLQQRRCTQIEAVVGDTNLLTQLFFRRCGFKAVRTCPDYFGKDCGGIVFNAPISCDGSVK